jgi:hypothetical protein
MIKIKNILCVLYAMIREENIIKRIYDISISISILDSSC